MRQCCSAKEGKRRAAPAEPPLFVRQSPAQGRHHQFCPLASGSQLCAGSACTNSTSAAAPQPSAQACEARAAAGAHGVAFPGPWPARQGGPSRSAPASRPPAAETPPRAARGRHRTCSSLRLRSAASSRTCASCPGCEVNRKASRSTDSRTGDVARACCRALSTSVMHTGGISAMAMYLPVAVGEAGGVRSAGELGVWGGRPGDPGEGCQGCRPGGLGPCWFASAHPAPPANGLGPEEFGGVVRCKAGEPGGHATTLVGDRQGPRRKRSRTTAAGDIPGSGVRGAGVLAPELFEDVIPRSAMLKPAECSSRGASGSRSKPMATAEAGVSARPAAQGRSNLLQAVRAAVIHPTSEPNAFVEAGSRRHVPFRHTSDGPRARIEASTFLPVHPTDGLSISGGQRGKAPLRVGELSEAMTSRLLREAFIRQLAMHGKIPDGRVRVSNPSRHSTLLGRCDTRVLSVLRPGRITAPGVGPTPRQASLTALILRLSLFPCSRDQECACALWKRVGSCCLACARTPSVQGGKEPPEFCQLVRNIRAALPREMRTQFQYAWGRDLKARMRGHMSGRRDSPNGGRASWVARPLSGRGSCQRAPSCICTNASIQSSTATE